MAASQIQGNKTTSAREKRLAISVWKLADESAAATRMLEIPPYSDNCAQDISKHAVALVEMARADSSALGLLDTFLSEYGLSNTEGVALMCLAESLLRIPDERTADQLIADKILMGDWLSHAGHATSVLVNASTWALLLTGKLVSVDREFSAEPGMWLQQLTNRLSEPVIRAAMRAAMTILGREFVLGATIDHALHNSAADGLYSFDMLGEGARDAATAARYFAAYLNAIETIASGAKSEAGPASISIKLSALHPRYDYAQRQRVLAELIPRVKQLCLAAAHGGVELTIDAEEAHRLELSLEVFQALASDQELRGLHGLGLAVQAYSKRALSVLDWLLGLASETERVFPVRLVKGAYWDLEIKHAQQQGLCGYPVFTRKSSTDASYLICARKILDHPAQLYGQFATHNAHSLAAVMAMAKAGQGFEFQRLHGMGEALYAAARAYYEHFPPMRIYAPVGPHDDLLAYLVRRLLENGANSSFINRFLDQNAPAAELVGDPLQVTRQLRPIANPAICLPADLFGAQRRSAAGVDLADAASVAALSQAVIDSHAALHCAASLVGGEMGTGRSVEVVNPARHDDVVGTCIEATEADLERAFQLAIAAQPDWDACGADQRAEIIERFADTLEQQRDRFIALLCREAGKTYADAVAEVREAVDFARYYASHARRLFGATEALPGPTGETNTLSLHGRGVFVCISPWNFPLAIFIGQVTAALGAGNAVLAKPAVETPIVAFEALTLLHQCGVPAALCHLILGGGAIGERLVRDPAVAGVAFTGGTQTAHKINRAMAETTRAIAPLIAETGGQNAMLVDSSALPEQVVDDVIQSAFLSAGQRCSALRVLYLQHDIAEATIEMLKGAMDELRIGDPALLATDVGPIISAGAARALRTHVQTLTDANQLLHILKVPPECAGGTFVAPALFEITHINELEQEHFGPLLHVIRFNANEFEKTLTEISNSGYGLTFGIHSRIESRVHLAARRVGAGNVYANRNMTGAVVGSQPFGGQRLSGTGPKAGGPNYLLRFASERVVTVNTVAVGGNTDLLALT